MPTGRDNNDHEVLAISLRFEKDRLIVELDDRREVSVPLSFYPTLRKARPAQRAAWELIGPGRGFHWEALDLDLSVRGLVSGLPEVIPPPPAVRQPKRRRALARRTS